MKCDGCSTDVDTCDSCNGVGRIQSDNCECPDGKHDNNGYLKDCERNN